MEAYVPLKHQQHSPLPYGANIQMQDNYNNENLEKLNTFYIVTFTIFIQIPHAPK
jgi:hypothetical protein